MPLTPEEPQIQESAPGSRNSTAATRTPQASRPAAPIPGPRAVSRPTPPRTDRKGPPPGRPGPVRTAGSQRTTTTASARTSAAIELVTATDATAVDVADETVDKLLDEGTPPGDVLVITTGEQHPWAQHELSFGEDAYWGQLADGEDVFCVHATASSRVTRRAVVVLAVNGGTDAQAAEALPAALAKAGRSLIVCGDPQRLRQLL